MSTARAGPVLLLRGKGPGVTSQSREDAPGLGIAAILAGMLAMSINDMLIKLLAGDYPLYQIVFLRSCVGLTVALVILRVEGGFGLLKSPLWRLLVVRGLLTTIVNMLFFSAIVVLPLAEVTALFFIAPLFSTILSIPLLGEKVGLMRWLAVVAGLVGVMVMVRPGTDLFTFVVLLPMMGAMVYSMVNLLARHVGLRAKASVMAVYGQTVFAMVSGLAGLAFGDGRFDDGAGGTLEFLLRAWTWMPPRDLALVAICGVMSGLIAYFVTQAYRLAAISVVAPFEYTSLPMAIFWGWLFWGEFPDFYGMTGIALIVAAGIVIVWREARLKRAGLGKVRPAR